MTAKLKNLVLAAPFAFALTMTSPLLASAAAPDGNGPWADSVLSSSQGLRKDGSNVPAIRSNTSSALGVAENDTNDGNFYSLGFGGSISLGFDNGISSGVILVEATNPGYPNETAKVEVSEDGSSWVMAGNVSTDGQVSKPDSIGCARYVRITDTSNPDNFTDATADGYDVDGVKTNGDNCTPVTVTPTPTPGGNGGNGGCSIKVNQSNTSIMTNVVGGTASTGNNKANKNTGGTTNITTGNASVNVNATNSGGSNVANLPSCGGGDINATIKDNGAGSVNTININSGSKNKKVPVKTTSKTKNK